MGTIKSAGNEGDAAIQFTNAYLNLLKLRLDITVTNQGMPQIVVDHIASDSIELLRNEIDELVKGKIGQKAISASMSFGREQLQVVGFGISSSLDRLVKMGMLIGDRVVLWDVICSRLLHAWTDAPAQRSVLAEVACSLQMLQPLVDNGVVVVLPHPITWSKEALAIDAQLRASDNRSATSLGLVMALIANKEGMRLHPYTESSASIPSTFPFTDDESWSRENRACVEAVGNLFASHEMAYLGNVDGAEFHKIVTANKTFRRSLRKHYIPAILGLTENQRQVELKSLNADLAKQLQRQKKEVFKYVSEGAEATALVLLAAFGDAVNLMEAKWLAIGGLATRTWVALRKWFSRPENNVLIQVFRELKASVQPETLVDEPVETKRDSLPLDDETRELKKSFNSLLWTEERHHFLRDLSLAKARKLLSALTPNEIARTVNVRRFQEDYIGDYLADLWAIDIESFWKHLIKVFDSEDGILIYDGYDYVDVLCTRDIPTSVWLAILESLLTGNKSYIEGDHSDYACELLGRIIDFQTTRASQFDSRRTECAQWFKRLSKNDAALVQQFFNSIFPEAQPNWLLQPTPRPKS
ncbi:MAG: hypothetical protein NTV80_26275 [Verrucomicrobia bacterium]|nr:hypothetical protein [Verrucomicrobiota bacterium]